MAKFVPDRRYPTEDQWRAHLQRTEYVKDITNAIDGSVSAYNKLAQRTQSTIRQAADETRAAIQETAHETQSAIREGADQVSEATLLAAIAQIESAQRNAAKIVGAIENSSEIVSQNILFVGLALDYRIGLLVDQERVNTLLLQDIGKLLRIPDFQKERLYYIEQGLKHYWNARVDSSLFDEALENLLKAEEREKTDYIVLHTIGMIYMQVFAHSDSSKAEQYFLRAGRYAAVETSPDARRLSDVLSGGMTALTSHPTTVAEIRPLAAEAYHQAGWACHAQRKNREAIEYVDRAAGFDPENILIRFHQSICLAADNQGTQAVQKLEPVIRAQRYYAAAAAKDPDLSTTSEVVDLLERLRAEAAENLRLKIAEIDSFVAPFLSEQGDKAAEMMGLKSALQTAQYLKLLTALDSVPAIMSMLQKWENTKAVLRALQQSTAPNSLFATDIHTHNVLVSSTPQFEIVERIHTQLCGESGQLVEAMAFALLINETELLLRNIENMCIRASQSVDAMKAMLRKSRKLVPLWSERVNALVGHTQLASNTFKEIQNTLPPLNYLMLAAYNTVTKKHFNSTSDLLTECNDDTGQLRIDASKARQANIFKAVVFGSVCGAILLFWISYNSPQNVAVRQEEARLVEIAAQQRRAIFQSQKEASRLMKDPVTVLDADSALAALQSAPISMASDPLSKDVFSKTSNSGQASRPTYFFDPVLISLSWSDPALEDVSRVATKDNYRPANAYELVSYAVHVGLARFPGGCVVGTGTVVLFEDRHLSPVICKFNAESRLIARFVRWAPPEKGDYTSKGGARYVLAIKQ